MGGKDAIVVDADCDLDSAVGGVLFSAFGYQGQKCSACSRAIVHERVYDQFVEKLKARAETLSVGPTDDPANYMGPVISDSARKSIRKYIEVGKGEGRVLLDGSDSDGDGYFLKPTIIADIDSQARIFQEEIFGPVLAVTKAKDFEHALTMANDSQYGLTGAIYSNDPAHVQEAARQVLCRQSICEPQMHRRHGRSPPLRRIQYVRH